MDSEIIAHLIVKSKEKQIEKAIIDATNQLEGSFCLLIMTKDTLYAIRDKNGFRPLCIGKIDHNNTESSLPFFKNNNLTWIIASESSALDICNAQYTGEVLPGEMIKINRNSVHKSFYTNPLQNYNHCIFELIYFARPDSKIFGQSVYEVRKKIGFILARESPFDVDLVVPIPDSGIYAALGYAQALNLSFDMAFTRNHYIGRSFIQPSQFKRQSTVRMKLNPIESVIKGKKIALVDDSIVRGTTIKERIKALKKIGVKEIHMLVASPPVRHSCYFGIDFPDEKTLIANKKNIIDIRDYLGLDSLHYLSLEGMLEAVKRNNEMQCNNYCHACYSGKYPIKVKDNFNKQLFE